MKLAEATFIGEVGGGVLRARPADIGVSREGGSGRGAAGRQQICEGKQGPGAGLTAAESVEGDGGEPEARDELADRAVVAVLDCVGTGRAERGVAGDPGTDLVRGVAGDPAH